MIAGKMKNKKKQALRGNQRSPTKDVFQQLKPDCSRNRDISVVLNPTPGFHIRQFLNRLSIAPFALGIEKGQTAKIPALNQDKLARLREGRMAHPRPCRGHADIINARPVFRNVDHKKIINLFGIIQFYQVIWLPPKCQPPAPRNFQRDSRGCAWT
jgi:hypothetical protein